MFGLEWPNNWARSGALLATRSDPPLVLDSTGIGAWQLLFWAMEL